MSEPLLESLIPIVRNAGRAILEIYATDFEVRGKADASPVTEADERAEALIVEGLTKLTPGIPIVAEEAIAAGSTARPAERFWLVDPLDGTKEFVSRNGEFTVNVGLIEKGRPVLGVVLVPALDRLFAGAEGQGAFLEEEGARRPIQCRPVPPEGVTVLGSRSHGDPKAMEVFLAGRKVAGFRAAGSSLKICLIAAGEADLYPRFGRTMEWDLAASHAVLAAAGGKLQTLEGVELRYGKPGWDNPHFVASGRKGAP